MTAVQGHKGRGHKAGGERVRDTPIYGLVQPDPTISRQQRRYAERLAAKRVRFA